MRIISNEVTVVQEKSYLDVEELQSRRMPRKDKL